MSLLDKELARQKQVAARTSKRLNDLRSGATLDVRVVSGKEYGYDFTRVEPSKHHHTSSKAVSAEKGRK